MKDRLEIKGALIGMIFGDAGLSKERKNAHLRISHCLKQKDYLLWKKEILEHLTSVSVWEGEVKCAGKMFPALRLWTKSHPMYTGLRARFYHSGRKTFDVHLLKRLTLLGLLLWFLDDGYRRVIKTTPNIELCTDNFNYIEQLSLQKYFHDKWGLTAKIIKHGNCWRLAFRVAEVRKLEKLFQPFAEQIPKCMRYKLDLSYEAHSEMNEEIVQGA